MDEKFYVAMLSPMISSRTRNVKKKPKRFSFVLSFDVAQRCLTVRRSHGPYLWSKAACSKSWKRWILLFLDNYWITLHILFTMISSLFYYSCSYRCEHHFLVRYFGNRLSKHASLDRQLLHSTFQPVGYLFFIVLNNNCRILLKYCFF